MANDDIEKKKNATLERLQNLSADKRKLIETLLEIQHGTTALFNSPSQTPQPPPQPPPQPEFSSGPNWQPGWQHAWQHDSQQDWRQYERSAFEQASASPNNNPPTSPLVAMKPSGSKPPFFCVHAIFGSAFPYFHLAACLDHEQPFYGLQSPGLNAEQPPLETIEEMATVYIEAIRSVQAQGPYYLGGYSFGSWVAFEMARQLTRQQQQIAFLAAFATGAPLSTNQPRLFEQLDLLLGYMQDYNKLVVNSLLAEQHRLQQPQLPPLMQVMEANHRAQLRYLPRPYAGPITVFATQEQQAMYPLDASLGWKMLSVEDVENVPIPGNHLSIFSQPHVLKLAEKLTFCLNQAQQDKVK